MAQRMSRLCLSKGCKAIHRNGNGYCDQHQEQAQKAKQEFWDKRNKARKAAGVQDRMRGRALQRVRKMHLAENPLCVMCAKKGIVRLATQLDHITALVNGGQDFNADGGQNRQGLCEPCHAAKTRSDMRMGSGGWVDDDEALRRRIEADAARLRG